MMQVQSIYLVAVIALIAAFFVSKAILLKRPHLDGRLLRNKSDAVIYAVSKASPVLAVAVALAADASGGTSSLNAVVGIAGLLFVAGLATWSVYARLTGQFFGLAHKMRAG